MFYKNPNNFNKNESGTVKQILDNGCILIEVNGENREYNHGEISLSNMYNKE